jgi:amino-acid N-acetyltransferase
MSVRIELAVADDASAIVQLLKDCALPPDGVLDHLRTALVARADHGVVGSAALEVYSDGALLRSVAVDTTMRGSGLGHRLTESALDLARTLHVPAVYLLTNTAAAFFPRFGFERIERAHVPDGVRGSIEFQSVSCSSAVAMRKLLADV